MSVEFITTNDSAHWYKSPTKDTYYPSATTILNAFPKGAQFNKYLAEQTSWESSQENMREAGKRGTNVHKSSELLESGMTVTRKTQTYSGGVHTNQEWQMLIGFVNWHNEHNPTLVRMEYSLVSDKYETGGTADRIYIIEGKRVLVDLKTSGAIYDSYWAQTAIYAALYEEKHPDEKIDYTAILRLSDKKKSGYEFVLHGRKEWKEDLKVFQATQKLWKYINPKAQPKILELPDSISLAKSSSTVLEDPREI